MALKGNIRENTLISVTLKAVQESLTMSRTGTNTTS